MRAATIGVLCALSLSGAGRASSALAVEVSQAGAQTPREAAEALIADDGEAARIKASVASLEMSLGDRLIQQLAINDPTVQTKLRTRIHDATAHIAPRLVETKLSFYASHYSRDELRNLRIFLGSAAIKEAEASRPLLRAELRKAFSADAPGAAKTAEATFAAASANKRALVERLLAVQNVEESAREEYAQATTVMTLMPPIGGFKDDPAKPDTVAEDAKAREAFVQWVLEVERGFYSSHWTDGQLITVIQYAQSPAAQKSRREGPELTRLIRDKTASEILAVLPTLQIGVCEDIACTPKQRDHTRSLFASLERTVTTTREAYDQ